MSEPKIESADPTVEVVAELEDRLYEFNVAATGLDDGEGLGFFVRADDGELRAGVAGHTWGGTCELRQVWVDESLRRRGLGTRLIQAAEAEARRRGCRQLVLSTHSFQATGFYAKLGYERVGELAEYPLGHAQVFLRKAL